MPSLVKANFDYTICLPCQYLDTKDEEYGYDYVSITYLCRHPDAHNFGPLSNDPLIAASQIPSRAFSRAAGKIIGKNVKRQPEWCPFVRAERAMNPSSHVRLAPWNPGKPKPKKTQTPNQNG